MLRKKIGANTTSRNLFRLLSVRSEFPMRELPTKSADGRFGACPIENGKYRKKGLRA
jgi:hypothetical protein